MRNWRTYFVAESIGYHSGCSGEIVLLEAGSDYSLLMTWQCQKCQLKFYSREQLEKCLEPPLHLRWKTDSSTGQRYLTMTTDLEGTSKYEHT
jgi:hypothetical protein